MVLGFSDARLTELFNNTDEALLEFAERAESNAVQGRFFEAMGEIRTKRPVIEDMFHDLVSSGFDDFGQGSRDAIASGDSDGGDTDELTLVNETEMDESVALENMIARARNAYFQQLYALGQRLAVVNAGRKVHETAIPSGPYHLATSFQAAIRDSNIDIKVKLILFALFEKYLLKQAKSVYDEFNDSLKEAGILPNLKPAYHRANGRPVSDSAAEPAGTGDSDTENYTAASEENLGEELFNSILRLMAARRGAGPGGAESRVHQNPVPAKPVSTAALVSAIDSIQPDGSVVYEPTQGGPAQILDTAVDQDFLDGIRDTLSAQRARLFSEVDRGQLKAADADMIDLIGMLFEYMLNDPVLPNVAKALISHLHTPYLKVAIVDRRLLTDHVHPARLLLDDLVEAGREWVHEQDLKRGIYPAMQQVVDRVLKGFSDNVGLFDELLTDFRLAIEEPKRKTEVIERRAQEAAKGREKLHAAKQRAAREMKPRVGQGCVPPVVAEFLTQTWSDKLVFILLRHPDGELSKDWKDALRTAEELVWLFEPKAAIAERQEMVRLLPPLRESIKAGLDSLGSLRKDHCNALLRLLEDPESLWAETQTLTQASDASNSRNVPPAQSPPRVLAPERKKTPAARESDCEGPTPPVTEPGQAHPTPEEEAMIKRLREVEFGTWFEFTSTDQQSPRRLKLSWLNPPTSTCMFVDRSHVNASAKSLQLLAHELVEGTAMMIEQEKAPFVERILKAIRRMLQGEAGKPS